MALKNQIKVYVISRFCASNGENLVCSVSPTFSLAGTGSGEAGKITTAYRDLAGTGDCGPNGWLYELELKLLEHTLLVKDAKTIRPLIRSFIKRKRQANQGEPLKSPPTARCTLDPNPLHSTTNQAVRPSLKAPVMSFGKTEMAFLPTRTCPNKPPTPFSVTAYAKEGTAVAACALFYVGKTFSTEDTKDYSYLVEPKIGSRDTERLRL